MINFTAEGNGYYRVFLNDIKMSQHLQEREAAEAAGKLKVTNPKDKVHYDHDYRVVTSLSQEKPPADPEPPVEPEEPAGPEIPPYEPPAPPDPEPETKPDPRFDRWATDPRCIGAISYRSQEIINKFTVNVKKGSDPKNNESIRYDGDMDAGQIRLAGSLSLTNRVAMHFPAIKSGMVVCSWDFHPAMEWQERNLTVDNHKWVMLGCNKSDERRRFEMRLLKYQSEGNPIPNMFLTDVRPYIQGADTTGEGSRLGRLTPYRSVLVPAGKWGRYVCSLRYEGEDAYFSYGVQIEGEEVKWAYQDVFIPRYAEIGVDFFDPTWCNTSQPSNSESIIYGWLRNAFVLWSDEPIDVDGVVNAQTLVEVK